MQHPVEGRDPVTEHGIDPAHGVRRVGDPQHREPPDRRRERRVPRLGGIGRLEAEHRAGLAACRVAHEGSCRCGRGRPCRRGAIASFVVLLSSSRSPLEVYVCLTTSIASSPDNTRASQQKQNRAETNR